MAGYYVIYIIMALVISMNGAVFMKKYQLEMGADLFANSLYMIINGVMTAGIPAMVLLFQQEALQMTPYSIVMAVIVALVAAGGVIVRQMAYVKGAVVVAGVCGQMGIIFLSCVWGILFLGERLTIWGVLAIISIVTAVLLITFQKKEAFRMNVVWLWILAFFLSGFTTVFNKVHQVEEGYAKVNTLSFSVWTGIVWIVLFSGTLIYQMKKNGRKLTECSKKARKIVGVSTIISSLNYLVTLYVAVVLPVTITSALRAGLEVGMCALLPLFLYKEKLSAKAVAGVGLAIAGIVLFAWN